MKKVLVEGSLWMGMWTEMTIDAMSQLGYSVDVVYSNKKPFHRKIWRFLSCNCLKNDIEKYYNEKVLSCISKEKYQYYISVSGKLNSEYVEKIKYIDSKIKIIYWIGDRFDGHIKNKFDNLYKSVDSIDAISFAEPRIFQDLTEKGFKKIFLVPFGVSDIYHNNMHITKADRKKFSCDVSFVGTHTPEREKFIRYLNERLDRPVQVWGRSWGGSGIKCRGRLSLADTLKVYACSRISLNIHQIGVYGGNMRYFEIPAVGGFQVCDWKQDLPRREFGNLVATYKNNEEAVSLIQFYLSNEPERQKIISELKDICFDKCTYKIRFEELFNLL